MELVPKLLIVFGLGAVEIWAAIPIGFALQLHPLLIAIVAALGGIVGVVLVAVLGDSVRAWILRRRGGRGNWEKSRTYRIWVRYGIVGLGLLAPLLTGTPAGTALGVVLGTPRGPLIFWMSMGVVVWSILITGAGMLGLAGISTISH